MGTGNINLIEMIGEVGPMYKIKKAIQGWEDGSFRLIDFKRIIPPPHGIRDDYFEYRNWTFFNWGCALNAYETSNWSFNTIRFYTDHGDCLPVVRELSIKNGEVSFAYLFDDYDDELERRYLFSRGEIIFQTTGKFINGNKYYEEEASLTLFDNDAKFELITSQLYWSDVFRDYLK